MEKTHLLEINLISAQNLKPPSSPASKTPFTRSLFYAIAHIDPSFKLRTQTRPGPNPNWNDKFLFRVHPDFLSSQISSVSISIFSVGYFSDSLIGTVRFLLPTSLSVLSTPAFSAVQIRRPSGRFCGILNVAAAVCDGGSIVMGSPAVCVRDIAAESSLRRRRGKGSEGGSDCECSDGTESSASSSASSIGSDGGGLLLGCLGVQRKAHLGPSDRILRSLAMHGKVNGN